MELDARLIHTGDHSMHVSVRVRSAGPTTPRDMQLSTQCLSIFVELDEARRPRPVTQLVPVTAEDRRLAAHAVDLIALRHEIAVIPPGLARFAVG